LKKELRLRATSANHDLQFDEHFLPSKPQKRRLHYLVWAVHLQTGSHLTFYKDLRRKKQAGVAGRNVPTRLQVLKLAAAFLKGAAISPFFEVSPRQPCNQNQGAKREDADERI
jgi:hypothetical protein